MSEQLNDLIRRTTELPSMPEVAFDVMRVADQSESSAINVAMVLAKDPGLSARVLRLANSSFYGMAREVSSITDAVVVLGMRSVKSLSLVAASFPWLHSALDGKGVDPKLLWNHSLTTAHMVRLMASKRNVLDVELPFCIALLHDIGTVVISLWQERVYDDLLQNLGDGSASFDEVEREAFGFDHAEVGAALTDVWNLPRAYGKAIRWHHTPSQADVIEPVADMIHVADMIIREQGNHDGLFGVIYNRDEAAFERLGFSEEELQEMLQVSLDASGDLGTNHERRAA